MDEEKSQLKAVKTYLTEEQHEALRKLAFESKQSIAEHVRKAVELYLTQQQK
ncbi:ribbon-helix-helix protein, CopG family [Brevibacillus porteri]|uniref:ribbon-helix-helix protein, CopG family n=1 Tax=Brevibacillus porteri TaxID=2126350 RepID=UPI003D2510A1